VNLTQQRPALAHGHAREGGLGRRGRGRHTGSASPIRMPKSGSSSTSHPLVARPVDDLQAEAAGRSC
jgi:hypothetical protein